MYMIVFCGKRRNTFASHFISFSRVYHPCAVSTILPFYLYISLQISSFIPKPRACIPSISFSLLFSTTLFVTRELYLRCHFSHAYARATCVICTRYRCCGRLGRMEKKIRKWKGEREWNR